MQNSDLILKDGLTEESAIRNAQNAVVTEWYWIMA